MKLLKRDSNNFLKAQDQKTDASLKELRQRQKKGILASQTYPQIRNTLWWGLGPIFREVKVRSIDGDLDVDDPASN